MNVLFLISDLGVGGSERKTIKIVNSLSEKGFNCHLLYLNGPHTLRDLVSKNVKLTCLERKRRVDYQCLKKYRTYVVENEIHFVYCINLYPLFFHRLAFAGRREKPKLSISLNTSLPRSRKNKLQLPLYVHLLKKGCHIIYGSQLQKTMWITKHKVKRSNGRIIYNGVDEQYFDPQRISSSRDEVRRRFGIEGDETVIGMVARFSPEKSHGDLLRAGRMLLDNGANIKILLAGNGPEQGKINQLVKTMKMDDRVILLGEVLDVRPALIAMDIFVLTSIAVETFSNAALEAMAMFKPVVLSDMGGSSEMVENGVNGFIYPPGDVEALTGRIQAIIENDLFSVMGQSGRKIIEDRFSFEKMVSEYQGCLFSV